MRKRLPTFLSILALVMPVFLATAADAAEIKVSYPARGVFVISGGSIEKPWHIRYGRAIVGAVGKVVTLAGQGPDAYFSDGNWLRRIDAEKGIVTGRWHFPGSSITALTLTDDHIQVEAEDDSGRRSFHRTIDFNVNDPHIPYWPTTSLFAQGVPEREMNCFCSLPVVNPASAREWLPEAENAVHRDPLSPWLRVALAHVYLSLGRTEANQLLDETSSSGPAEFGELFRLSSRLDSEHRTQAARVAFDRGYENYWQLGNDPRMLIAIISRIFFYPFPMDATEEMRPELIERGYRLAPWVAGADDAWDAYAGFLRENGNRQEGQKWSARAAEARSNSLFPMNAALQSWFGYVIMLVPATLLAGLLYWTATFLRYLPERKIQIRAERQAGTPRRLGFFNVEYWSGRDRIVFLTILVVGWLSLGLMGSFVSLVFHESTAPLSESEGTFAGPTTIADLESLPKTPERDLLLAMAYQHDDQAARAEALYRELPQFPESWNNLGVLLKNSGKGPEAKQAFERAVQLDPQIAEARLNLGNPPSDYWTESHQRYLPERAMLAPPRRERMMYALGFGSVWQIGSKSLLGPIATGREVVRFSGLGPERPPNLLVPMIGLIIVLLLLAVIISALRPVRDVTQAAPRYQIIVELLLPGTAAEWRYLGGIALTAWAWASFQWFLIATQSRVRFLPYSGIPNIRRAFGIPVGSFYGYTLGTPTSYAPFLGIIVFLYVVNAALIWYSRQRHSTTPVTEA
jgi:tetratricopeptide (TPR) repeat protein